MADPPDVVALQRRAAIADAYRDAALATADMTKVTADLVGLQQKIDEAEHFLDTGEMLADLVGAAWARPELDAFRTLRARLLRDYTHAERQRLQDSAFATPRARWEEFVRSFARCVSAWKLEVCAALATVDLGEGAAEGPLDMFRERVEYLVKERWAEGYPIFEYLAEADEVPPRDRGRINALCAAVQIYFFESPDKALELLSRAEELAPEESIVYEVRGDLYIHQSKLDEARVQLDRAMALKPGSAGALASMGDLADKGDTPESAESWYREAIRHRPGSSTGYTRMCRFLGRPDVPEEKAAEISELVARSVSVDPLGEHTTYLSAGWAYQSRDETEVAREWFDRAIANDPLRPDGHAALGHLLLGSGAIDEAREAFERAIEVAPESLDGHWGLALLEEQEANWAAAEASFRRSLQARPEWGGAIIARAAYAAFRQGDREAAVEEIVTALMADPDNEMLRSYAERIADETESEFGDLEGADAVYDAIAGVLGDTYSERHGERIAALRVSAALRKNREANALYSAGDYSGSIPLYEEAIELDFHDPVYHANLSSAWELAEDVPVVDRLDRAIECLDRAAAMANDPDEYRTRQLHLQTMRESAAVYGEAISRLPVVTPIALEVGNTIVPMVEGEGADLAPLAQELIEQMRERVREGFGVKVPGIRIRVREGASDPGEFVILLMEVPLLLGSIRDVPLEDDPDAYERHALEHMLGTLEGLLERNLGAFLGIEALDSLLWQEASEWREKWVGDTDELSRLERVFRAMLAEGVGIRPIGPICERYAELRQSAVPAHEIVERLRALPEVREHLPGAEGHSFFAVSDAFLDVFERSINTADGHPLLAMLPEDCQATLTAVRNTVTGERPEALIVHRPVLRPFVRRLLELEFPTLPVLAASELADAEAAVVDTVRMDGEDKAPAATDRQLGTGGEG